MDKLKGSEIKVIKSGHSFVLFCTKLLDEIESENITVSCLIGIWVKLNTQGLENQKELFLK